MRLTLRAPKLSHDTNAQSELVVRDFLRDMSPLCVTLREDFTFNRLVRDVIDNCLFIILFIIRRLHESFEAIRHQWIGRRSRAR
jgi:hypothetical protein